jgi:hypothetical protein
MMSSIASIGQLAAVIQSQFKARAQAAAPGKARRPARRDTQSLTSLIELRVAQIDPDDPQRGRKAFRVFLESVLLQELGGQLNADPKFHQLVDDVQRVLERDTQCAPLLQDAISYLLAARPADTTTGKS